MPSESARVEEEHDRLDQISKRQWRDHFAPKEVGFKSGTLQHLSDDEYKRQVAIREHEEKLKREDSARKHNESFDELWNGDETWVDPSEILKQMQ